MKKIYLFVSLLFAAVCANAQFFQHLYGNSSGEALGNGLNTNATGLGHFIVAPSFSTSSFSTEVLAVNTDVSGVVNAFNNSYALIHSSGVTLDARNTLPIEFNNGSGYGVIGQFTDPSSSVPSGIYYLELDAAGNVVNTTEYNPVNIPGTNFYVVEVGGVRESPGGDIYITGTVDPTVSTGSFWMFAMKIDQAGNILWAVIYDIVNTGFTSSRDWGKDIMESPYTPTGAQEAIIVGQTYGNGGSSDGFFMRLDATNGSLIANPYIYGTTATFESFTCIDIANSTVGGAPGFIIGGTSDNAGSWDYWLTKTDDQGNPFWTYTYDYNGGAGNFDNCTDVVERYSAFNGYYEYYASGTTDAGNVGNADLVVVKVDDNGTPLGNDQFTYGSSADDMGSYLDYYDGGTGSDGLSVFGTFTNGSIGASDAYHVKAYFNGLSGCNEDIANTASTTGPGLYTKYRARLYSKLNNISMSANSTSASDANLCYATSIGGGSNNRTALPDNSNPAMVVSPNPMQAGTALVNVTFESETATEATVSIYDVLGRTYYNGTIATAKGSNMLPIDISSANMAPGLYTVRISSDENTRTVLLLVK